MPSSTVTFCEVPVLPEVSVAMAWKANFWPACPVGGRYGIG
jgi:hypothetical protein